MLDMSFQLLAFFVMTFQAASAAEGQLDMFLPTAGEAKAKAAGRRWTCRKTSDVDIDQQSDLTVVVEAARERRRRQAAGQATRRHHVRWTTRKR